MSNQEPVCGDIFWKIHVYYYYNIYVYITIPTCLVGMILNLLNVLVFTRKTMNSPPNLILTHLAFVDFLYLLSTIAQFWVINIEFESDFHRTQSYGWTVLYWYNDLFLCTVQFISLFLTVQMATWRYIAVVHPLKERHWCTKKITRNVVMTGYVVSCVLFAVPYYLSHDIDASNIDGITYYIFKVQHPVLNSVRNVVNALVTRVLTSLVLAVLTSRIVIVLLSRKTHREQLSPSASTRSGMKNVETKKQTNRSTAVLLAVVALFFIAEFPKGILWLLRMINKRDWGYCYDSLMAIFITVTIINMSITFIVYYTLSQQFRTTFKSFFNLNKRATSHQTHTPLALGDTEDTESGRKTTEV